MHRVGFVLLPQFSHLGVSAAIQPLFVANWLARREAFAWTLASTDGRDVRASSGLAVTVAGDLAALAKCDTVFLAASFDWHDAARDRALLDWLRRRARFGTELGGIENGSLALAEAGLLDGRRVAVHWDNLDGFRARYPGVLAVAAPHARDRSFLTCAGGSAVLDMMVAWIGEREGRSLAQEVAAHLLTSERLGRAAWVPGETARARSDPMVSQALALMQDAIHQPIACTESRVASACR